jgi:nucleotide-binding universal stress UspA family protein
LTKQEIIMADRIVVGVDGSDHAHGVMEFAYEEARRRGCGLTVVYAYATPVYWGVPEFGAVVPPRTHDDLVAEANEVLDRSLGQVPDDVEVERVVVEGPPARCLLETAEDADLLIVGSRGHGGFMGLLLGSTSHQVVTHATCPVVVVPSNPDA